MAILGRNTASGFGNFLAPDQIRVYRVTVSATAQLNELYASISNSGATVTIRCVCYAADGSSGNPGTLLAVGSDISVPNSGYTTRGGVLPTPAVLTPANYWLGVHMGGPNSVAYDDDGTGLTRQSTADTFVGGAGNPWVGTASNITGSMQCWGVTGPVTLTPAANFTGTPLTGTEPLTVAFTDTSTNGPTSWAWTFGDGGTSSAQNPTHTYTTAGTFTVALTATNSGGSNTFTRTGYVTVADQPRPIRINTSQGWADIGDATAFVSGTGAPTAAVGATGAIYLNTASGLHYGPKASGAWPGTPLPVPAGTDATTSSKGIVQLAGDLTGTAAAPQLKVPYGISLPASPADGQEAILVDSTTNPSYQWRFRFNSGSSSAYKWEFIGGSAQLISWYATPQIINALTQVATTGYYYANVPGAITSAPRAGDYLIDATAVIDPNGVFTSYARVVQFAGTTPPGPFGQVTPTAGFYYTASLTAAPVTGVSAGAALGVAVGAGVPGTMKLFGYHGTITPRRVS